MLTPRTSRSAKAGQRCASAGVKSSETDTGQSKPPATGFERPRLQRAEPRRREISRDAGDAGRVRAVGRQVDVDDGIVEAGVGGIGDADRRVVGQVDDAVVILGKLELGFGAEHAVELDAADDPLGERDLLAGDVGPDRREHAFHARPRVRRAADDLHRRASRVDHADAQAVGVRMRRRLDHARDDEALRTWRRGPPPPRPRGRCASAYRRSRRARPWCRGGL